MIMKTIRRKHRGRSRTTACYTRARRVRPQHHHLQLQHVCIGNQQTIAGWPPANVQSHTGTHCSVVRVVAGLRSA